MKLIGVLAALLLDRDAGPRARNSRSHGRKARPGAWAALAAAVLCSVLPVAAGAAQQVALVTGSAKEELRRGSRPVVPGERVALVIGNGAYENPDAVLRNPVNDADGMAAALVRLGFEVVLGKDLDRDGFFGKVGEFARKARESEVALFFYAGHGLQVHGKNWLAPVDASFEGLWDLEHRGVKLDTVMDSMRGRHNLVFLDACRNNPLAGELARSMGMSRSEGANRGLARVEKGAGGSSALRRMRGTWPTTGPARTPPSRRRCWRTSRRRG